MTSYEAAWRSLYPFPSQTHTLLCGGWKYHYIDTAPGDTAREVLLMVHGNPTWSFYWRRLIEAFRDRYRVIAIDHIGCGLSDKPSPQQYLYRLSQRVSDLVSLIDALSLRRVTLIAHDWGGTIGLGAACARPDVFARLALLNTGAFTGEQCPLRIRVCRTPLFGRLAICGLNLFARSAVSMAVTRPLSREVAAGLLAPYDSWSNRVATCEFVRDIPLSPRHPSFATLKSIELQLPQLAHKPVALLWGMRDWCFTPAFLRRFQEFFPHAHTCEFPDAGHYVVEDAPDEVIKSLANFLAAE